MDNYYGGSKGGGYTMDDFNDATGVSSSTKTSNMHYDRGSSNQ